MLLAETKRPGLLGPLAIAAVVRAAKYFVLWRWGTGQVDVGFDLFLVIPPGAGGRAVFHRWQSSLLIVGVEEHSAVDLLKVPEALGQPRFRPVVRHERHCDGRQHGKHGHDDEQIGKSEPARSGGPGETVLRGKGGHRQFIARHSRAAAGRSGWRA